MLARLFPWRALECLFFGSCDITIIFYLIFCLLARTVVFLKEDVYYGFIVKGRYIFIAAGIGITPFRSILVDCLYSKKRINCTLFYIAKSGDEFIFKEELKQAKKLLGIDIIYIISGKTNKRRKSSIFLDRLLKKYKKNFKEYRYFLSGPQTTVLSYQTMLLQTGIDEEQILTDRFTGYEDLTGLK
jgi:ferredoxin-NADP reductase